jgi:sugar/nucleoside kinase (ribokinase family)
MGDDRRFERDDRIALPDGPGDRVGENDSVRSRPQDQRTLPNEIRGDPRRRARQTEIILAMAEQTAAPAKTRSRQAPSICTIGDPILDVIVLPDEPLQADSDTPATIRFTAGGQAANVAAWASALGARSRLICKRGDDLSAVMVANELERHGVEICGPVVSGRGGVVVSVRDSRGQRTMTSDRGVAALLKPSEIDPHPIRDSDVLHISGYCLLREPMAEAAIAAARHAERVTVDLASAHDIAIAGGESFAARVKAVNPNVIFATEAERAALPDLETAWVIKLGAQGARFPEGLYPAHSAEPVDTTGAGDALAAGYLVGGPELAMTAAARCVTLVGAMPPADA